LKKTVAGVLGFCLLVLSLAGCGASDPLDPKNPMTLTMWHNFGGDMQKTADLLIDEFNATVGKEEGVIISVETISSSATIQDAMNRIVNEDPGVPKMPDIATAYPRTAIQFQAKGLLADLDEYFTEEALSAYIPEFTDEGRFGDGGLYVFPLAKSTELLFVNRTLFDRFAADTGVTMDCFHTFEGIADAAAKYYEWTDAVTPELPRDHKQFYTADSWFNLAQAGMLQHGANLFDGEALALDNDAYRDIWETLYAPSVAGGFALYDGYSSDLSKTGDIICSTGSSAGILFYGDTVTYPDGTMLPVAYSVLPYPVFEGGEKIAIQRGNGLMVAKSDTAREYAAAVFLKWFTAPEQNMRFVAETGYLPVTRQAFETYMPERIESVENPYIEQMLEAVTKMYAEYEFFTPPAFEAFDGVSRNFEAQFETVLSEHREAYVNGGGLDPDGALEAFMAGLKP
jgi:multiple sugar transport system substrate-binding protein